MLICRHVSLSISIPRTHFKSPFSCDWLQSLWDCVVGEKGSRRTSVRLQVLFTFRLAHKLFAQSRFKISFEMGSSQPGQNPQPAGGSAQSRRRSWRSPAQSWENYQKTACKNNNNPYTLAPLICGCSSVVERHVANVNVVGSNLITRFLAQRWEPKTS